MNRVTEENVVEKAGMPAQSAEPRFYYGWVMLPVAVVGVIATSPGQTFGIAAFNKSFRMGLGLTHSQLTGAYMMGTLVAALPLSYVGVLMDRHGLRRITVAAVLLLGLACGMAAMADGLVTLFVAFFLLRLLGPGAMSLLSSNTLAFWFHRRLGMQAQGLGERDAAGLLGVFAAEREFTFHVKPTLCCAQRLHGNVSHLHADEQ
ncbi:MAG TPA: hypothetical protein VN688_25645 [Gemmataceae bacterium]|nr:hypothetical protein [Gemmataceae bacterium]